MRTQIDKKPEVSPQELRKHSPSTRSLFISRFLAVPFLVLALGGRAVDAWAEAPSPLTWEDCVRLAARQNPDLLSALRTSQASQAQYRGSFNSILPRLSLTNSYTKSDRTVVSAANSGAITTTSQSGSELWQAQMSASLDVINPSDWAGIRSSAATYQQSQANLRVAATNVLLSLYKGFSGLLYAQQEGQVATEIQDIWKKDAQMIALRYASGTESKGNKMRTDAELLQANLDLTQASRDVRAAQQTLAQALGETQFQALQVTGTWTQGQLPAEPPALEAVLDQEPRVQAQQAVVRQQEAAIASARSSLFPTLSLNYNRGYQDTTEFPTSNPFWTFTGLLSYPLFGGGPTSTYYAVSAAKRNLEKAQLDLASVRNQVRADLENAWSSYAQAIDTVRVQQAFLDAARQRRKESDIRYQNGLMTYEEWQLVIVDLVNFEKSYLKSQQNLLLAEAQWRFARGEQVGEPQ